MVNNDVSDPTCCGVRHFRYCVVSGVQSFVLAFRLSNLCFLMYRLSSLVGGVWNVHMRVISSPWMSGSVCGLRCSGHDSFMLHCIGLLVCGIDVCTCIRQLCVHPTLVASSWLMWMIAMVVHFYCSCMRHRVLILKTLYVGLKGMYPCFSLLPGGFNYIAMSQHCFKKCSMHSSLMDNRTGGHVIFQMLLAQCCFWMPTQLHNAYSKRKCSIDMDVASNGAIL